MMMKKRLAMLLALLLCLALPPVQAENRALLGQPFPDFTATDTEGNVFTLSEALKEKKAVLINLWASWCPPCRAEFPYMDEMYALRADDVAVIALSIEETDTLETISQFRQELGLSIPMGRDEGLQLDAYVNAYYIPTTVIVDRFGNACFMHSSAVTATEAFLRLVDSFLGDDYTATRVLDGIPPARVWETGAGEGARKISLSFQGEELADAVWLTEGNEAELRFRLLEGAADGDSIVNDADEETELAGLYDPADGAYHYRAVIPDGQSYAILALVTGAGEQTALMLLIRGEKGLQALSDDFFGGNALDWKTAE